MSTKKFLGVYQYAKHRGVHHRAVQEAVNAGRITCTKDEKGRKLIDPELADKEWMQNTDQALVPVTIQQEKQNQNSGASRDDDEACDEDESEDGISYYAARAKKEFFRAELEKLKFEQADGKLVELEEVQKQLFSLARTTREALLNLPNRIANELASETDPIKTHSLLTRAVNEALKDLCDAKLKNS